jgi:cyclic pyranopterin phosphate synthase
MKAPDPAAALSHLQADGSTHMVDVGGKSITKRQATALAELYLPPACHEVISNGGVVAKGNVLETARLAGIMAAKKTADLIPLCHPLPLTAITIDFEHSAGSANTHGHLRITATVACRGQTGVEMEALTAASVAGLTLYDMLKAVSHDMVLSNVQLLEKSGGRSGVIQRTPDLARDT